MKINDHFNIPADNRLSDIELQTIKDLLATLISTQLPDSDHYSQMPSTISELLSKNTSQIFANIINALKEITKEDNPYILTETAHANLAYLLEAKVAIPDDFPELADVAFSQIASKYGFNLDEVRTVLKPSTTKEQGTSAPKKSERDLPEISTINMSEIYFRHIYSSFFIQGIPLNTLRTQEFNSPNGFEDSWQEISRKDRGLMYSTRLLHMLYATDPQLSNILKQQISNSNSLSANALATSKVKVRREEVIVVVSGKTPLSFIYEAELSLLMYLFLGAATPPEGTLSETDRQAFELFTQSHATDLVASITGPAISASVLNSLDKMFESDKALIEDFLKSKLGDHYNKQGEYHAGSVMPLYTKILLLREILTHCPITVLTKLLKDPSTNTVLEAMQHSQ